ncbi:hypothetical protein FFLO_04608 [Filobasidium floriforme]|uniref:Uncharacterized protein n=1 Tax=Filobasidium floriforme TaxID=5210 RepID=A0A8K0JII3_9TREE|nr:hypothetical protein FFLO_04608 [Filobasidium floriforme]
METLAGLAPANLFNHIIGVFSKPIIKPDGSLNLVKAALFSCTLSAGASIYSKYRQLAYMKTPAYRPPIDTKTKGSKEPSDSTTRVEQIKHKFRYEILLQGIQLSTSYGMLLGGLDKLWSFASNTAGRLVRSPDSFGGRLISNAVFTFAILHLNFLISAAVHRLYSRLTSEVDDSYKKDRDVLITTFANVWYMKNKEKRERVLKWPGWKKNAVAFGLFGLVVGLPCVALTGLYEWLGPGRVEPMAMSVGLIGISIVTLINGPILWKRIKDKDAYARKSTKDPRKGAIWPTLAEWAEKKELSFDVTEFKSKVRAMIAMSDDHVGSVELVVRPDNWEKEDEETSESWKALEFHSVAYLPETLLICLKEHQLESRDLTYNLALVSRAIVTKGYMKHFYLGQGVGLLSVSFFAILHHFYAKNPSLLLDVFPSLPATSTMHIPLAVSLTMTNYLTEWTNVLFGVERQRERKSILRDDRRVQNLLPNDNSDGWTQVIREEARVFSEQLNGRPVDMDLGTLDGTYTLVSGRLPSETERIAALQS